MRIGTFSTVIGLAVASLASVLATVPAHTWWGSGTLSLASGVAALVMMAAAALLGSRWGWVESLLGGLDRVYETHKWLGVWALVFASVHLVFKAGAEGWETAAILGLPGPATRLVRQLSYVALVVIVMLALNRAIPYRTWRWWHKLSGPLFLIVVLHWLSFRSPVALDSPAGLWLAAMSALGIAGAFYKLLLYPLLANHSEYRVTSVAPAASGVSLELAPVGRGVEFLPGQFGFLAMKVPGMREPHPFTIASAGGERVRFLIRALGDYTNQLVAEVREGMYADVYAPFGRFQRRPGAAAEIWVAGGVGISPFLAWLEDSRGEGLERVTLFYCHVPDRALLAPEAVAAVAGSRGARLVSVSGNPDQAFDDAIIAIIRDAGGDVQVHACGPRGLVARVRELLRAQGVPGSRLHYERFEFR